MEITGKCLCSTVQYRVNGAPKAIVNCHCNFCRSHSGAAFMTFVVIPEETLEITSGQDAVTVFRYKENGNKHFCRNCGTPIYNQNMRYAGMRMIYLGSANEPAQFVPTANIYCESQLPWVPEVGQIRSFPQGIAKRPV